MEGPFRTPSDTFADATDEAMAPHLSWMEPHALCPDTGKLIFTFQSYLVRSRHHTILIDTCIGCDKTIPYFPEWHERRDRAWLANLAAAGVEPEGIDYVFCSHLHVDHCGWNTSLVDGRWLPTFPNAKYVFAKDEYEASAAADTPVFRESVLPVMEAGQAQLVATDFALDDEIWLQSTPGHTAGHVAVNLSSNGRGAVMSGDLIHSPVQCLHPDWSPRFDSDKDLAARTRRRFLEENSESDRLVLTAHFPSPSIGQVVAKDDAFRFLYEE
jgi:glyoxylase-like metal-dependent hydrolase (beta-lactamase superfamily II)